MRTSSFALLLTLPAAGLGLLTVQPHLDATWEDHRAHFWLVVCASALSAGLAYSTAGAARRRGDVRVGLVSVAFLAAAGFLGLHALATPGVLLDASNAGFALATPVGLLVAGGIVALSAVEWGTMQCVTRYRRAVMVLLAVWGTLSLAELWPFDSGFTAERASGPLLVIAAAGVTLYGLAVYRYAELFRRRPSTLLLIMIAAFVLLAQAMVSIALARNWQATWWEWHLLMLAAFGLIAWGAQREWHEERFSDLYQEQTAAGERDVSVIFADLQGFTGFSERHSPREVSRMLNTYFSRTVPPVVQRYGGEVDRIVGDALMVTFNRRGDQPDHAQRAAAAALALQEAATRVADAHADAGWPRFRVGVNSGVALVTVLGAGGGRTHTVIGDTVNLASRLESSAPVGGVAVGPETARRLEGASLEPLGRLQVRGRVEPVDAQQLIAMD